MKANIIVPTSLNELTLEQYQKFIKIDTEENRGTTFHMQKLVEIFCNLDLKNVASIKLKSMIEVANSIAGLFDKDHEFIDRFEMDNVKYGFIPLLDEISFGEYVDLDHNLTDWNNVHKAMAVLYRPITEEKNNRYEIEEYQGIKDANRFLKMPLDVVLGSFVFFYHLGNELLINTLNYLDQATRLDTHQMKILRENGDGLHRSLHSLREMLQDMKISLN